MTESPDTNAQIKARAQKLFDEARAATNGVGKRAALWAAALLIVWVSSLEPTWRSVVMTARNFREINADRQEAEGRAAFSLRRVATERKELEQLSQFDQKYPAGKARDQERIRLALNLKIAQKKWTPFEKTDSDACEASEACKGARAEADFSRNELRDFNTNVEKLKSRSLTDRKVRLDTEEAKLTEEPSRLMGTYADARKRAEAQERSVSFELFGLRFKAPPLLAPLLWCVLCAALLGYLARARTKSVAASSQGFRLLANSPKLSGGELADLAGRLPTWTIEPALSNFAAERGHDRTLLAREPWVHHVFGSLPEQQLVAFSTLLIPLFAWIAELRVAWIALEFSRYLGMTRVRAVLPLALLMVLGLTMWIGWWWLSAGWGMPSLDREGRGRWLFGGICTALLVTALMLAWYPAVGIHLGFLLQQSLLWMVPFSIGIVAFGTGIQMAGTAPPADRGFTRRGLLIACIGIFGTVVLTKSLPLLRRAVQDRKKRKQGPELSLEQGFYRRKRRIGTKIDGYGEETSSKILHYIGPKSKVSRRDSLPPVGRLKKEPAPIGLRFAYGRRVNLATASWSFEESALAILRKGPVDRRRSRQVCELLLSGVRHDLMFKQRIKKERKKGRPSFRLYDLLAGIAVRYRHEAIFQQMIDIIASSGHQLVFQTRIEKWQDVSSPWRRRWRNRKEPITWKGDSGAVVF